MVRLVADTSGLVSLVIADDQDPSLLSLCLAAYSISVPETVIDELQEMASYDDVHGRAAGAVLDRRDDVDVQSVPLDNSIPLDDGENAAVTLANEAEAELCLCDEFNRLGLIHASLVDTRLVTTPTLLALFVRNGHLSPPQAREILVLISEFRSWEENSYVERARSHLDEVV